jgi:NADPH:quinone reductase-like Zn-dependent oxidoreductase
MRAVVVTKHGGPEVLRVQERPEPVTGPGQARIEVAAAGINFADVMARIGVYPDAPKPPCVVGYEVAGTVVEVGPGVEGVVHGERVMAATEFGGYADQVVVPAADVIALPEGMSFEEGAAVPINYATAWSGLVGHGNLQPGERVLIHAAGGGVGIAATQIAKHHGAEVYGTASPGKHDAIRRFGVDHAIDYRVEGWQAGLPKFDLVMDALGGKSFRISYELLRPGGRLVAFGASAIVSGARRNPVSALRTVLAMPRFNMIKQMRHSKTVIGLNLLTEWRERGSIDYWAAPLRELLEDGTIKPVVAATFEFERAGEAQQLLVERRNVGKVLLVP